MIRASNLYRRYLCPGSNKAEEGLPDTESEASRSGTRIHNYIASQFGKTFDFNLVPLDAREQSIADRFIAKASEIMQRHGGAYDIRPEYKMVGKVMDNDPTADLLFCCHDGTVHIVDFKTGYSKQDEACMNLQLRAYAVEYWIESKYEVDEIYVHLFAAGNEAEEQFSSTLFGKDELFMSCEEIKTIVFNCHREYAERRPSLAACKWCKACGNMERCPESINMTANISENNIMAITKAPEKTSAELAAVCEKVYANVLLAEQNIKRFKEWLREQVRNNPELFPSLGLKEGKTRRSITSVEQVFNIGLEHKWWNQQEFINEAVSVSITDVEKLIKRNADVTMPMVKQMIETELGAYIEKKQDQPSIELKK